VSQATESTRGDLRGRAWVKPTRLLLAAAALVTVAGAAMSFVGAATTGISGDEDVHVRRLNNYLDRDLYVKGNELRNAGDAIPANAYVYAPATTMILHEANVVMGKENLSEVERTRAAYTGRHLGIAAFALVGLIAAGAIAWLLLGSWQWGVVAAAVLAAVPMWTGHAMFNPKDVPVAVGHTLVTLGLLLLASPRTQKHAVVLTRGGATVLAIGSFLMLGTRPGMWPSLAASLVLFLAVLGWTKGLHRSNILGLVTGLMGAYIALFVLYPRVFSHPLTMLWRSALSSSGFQHLELATDRGYLPRHVIQEWPLIILGFVALGAVVGLAVAAGRLRDRSAGAVGLLLVGSQMLTLPVLAVVEGTPLYNGLRQVLFSVPAAAVLATVGLAAVFTLAGRPSSRWMWSAVAVAGLLLPTAAQVAMFPYQYASLNPAADLAGAQDETDYWDTSFRALVHATPSRVKVVCPHWAEGGIVTRDNIDCRTRSGGTFSPYWKATHRPALDRPKGQEFYALLNGSVGVPRNCHTVSAVNRWRNFSTIAIGRLLKCEPPTKAELAKRADEKGKAS
jgi:hypothetical protein